MDNSKTDSLIDDRVKQIEVEQKENQRFLSEIESKVKSNLNVLDTLKNRIEFECIELKDVYTRSLSNDKLRFFFKKKFYKVPKVVVTFKGLRLKEGVKKEGLYTFKLLTQEPNINLKSFSYSIDQNLNTVVAEEMLSIDTLEVCYMAFENLGLS